MVKERPFQYHHEKQDDDQSRAYPHVGGKLTIRKQLSVLSNGAQPKNEIGPLSISRQHPIYSRDHDVVKDIVYCASRQ